jgi:hypothetical protein
MGAGENERRNQMTKTTNPEDAILIDAELLPLFKKAEQGCLKAQVGLSVAFCRGEGARKNEKAARKYETMIFNNTDDVFIQLGTLYNPAIRAHERKDKAEMIRYFERSLYFMLRNIPMQQWDFSLLAKMRECIFDPDLDS